MHNNANVFVSVNCTLIKYELSDIFFAVFYHNFRNEP